MALKRGRKAQRRKQVVTQNRRAEAIEASLPARVLRAAQAPIQHCLVTESLFETGMGTLILARGATPHHLGRRRVACLHRSAPRPQTAAQSCRVVAIDRFCAAPRLRRGGAHIRRRQRGRKRSGLPVRQRRQAAIHSGPVRKRHSHPPADRAVAEASRRGRLRTRDGGLRLNLQGYWQYKTRFGTFSIVPGGGRFQVMHGDEDLGSYHSAAAALDDLVGGHTYSPSSGIDTSECGLPDEISEWTFVRTA
jgi:hypothetical protein